MSDEAHVTASEEFDEAARVLEQAVLHLRIAADHFRTGEVPRGCAHAFAAYGHMHTAGEHLNHRAIVHAEKART